MTVTRYFRVQVGAMSRLVQASNKHEAIEKCKRVWPNEPVFCHYTISDREPFKPYVVDSWIDGEGVWFLFSDPLKGLRVYYSTIGGTILDKTSYNWQRIVLSRNTTDHALKYTSRGEAFEKFQTERSDDFASRIEIRDGDELPDGRFPWTLDFTDGRFYYCFNREAAVMEHRLTN